MDNTVLYIIRNYFLNSYFEYDKRTSICRIQLKRGCSSMMLHRLSGGKVCAGSVKGLQLLGIYKQRTA